MIALVFAMALSAFGATDSLNAFEKSYPRDNSFCSYKGKRIEIMIRGGAKFTEVKDNGYGELVFYRKKEDKPIQMQLSTFHADTFRFFLGSSPLCSKSHGYVIDNDTLAILLLKENRPFLDKLVVQFFDSKTMKPKGHLETDYPVDRAVFRKGGFAVRASEENLNREIGKVMIEGQPFIFNEKDFPKWYSYSAKGFETSPKLTFDKFPWRESFKDIQEFYKITGYDQASGKFTKDKVFLAVNFSARKRCLLFIDKKRPLTNSESWRCQAM